MEHEKHYQEIKLKYMSKIGIPLKTNYMADLNRSKPIPIPTMGDELESECYNSYERWSRKHLISEIFGIKNNKKI